MNLAKYLCYAAVGTLALASCKQGPPTSTKPGKYSSTTGLEYNTEQGMKVADYQGIPEGPGLVFIEGGRTVLGSSEEDVAMTRDNVERTVTIASFYMDEAEVANIHWLEYLHFVRKDSAEEFYQSALPDTTVWARELSFNDPYVDYYLRYPGFRYFPVVGVSWLQANDYCTWRTAKVNEKLAGEGDIEDGGGKKKGGGLFGKKKNADAPADAAVGAEGTGKSKIAIENGNTLPNYRLPTEAEWEYAAQALIGTQETGNENQENKRIYPWDGRQMRNPYGKKMGQFLANFKRGRGDYAGIAGSLNDGAMITEYVYAYPPNDYGLYNMSGNVNEWVQDIYRPLSFQDEEDLNPFRRNGFLDKAEGYDKKGYQSLIDDHVRVFKGGSWKDVAYWLSPGTRRFMAEDSATAAIGFRCAMINAGSNK
ncbi:SUMF1/EgtB/PvdO family nonheme iron enzyme [Hymenobacter lutimineralis]|uniref:SUMF1/EgtB/PvdO family nonheme iron enzyme n=1 Tax=Hymenobacter lutimineralis TaxID=2606448 RepID=A0A5D6V9C4_9BACT|nr:MULTISPECIES: SUMF1/EgtB/PvdO family nonheme iron enzyme [Hymenobacter]QIX61561.1 SUMF1/EgtB/PvdO family nonheme iron enzyme [Hymenobacter sp. BT18]TYZ11429.1 SUMF1/EgtB/PvdO family nonheme iron enzyme [Hymenobacter lutimineralis]